VSEVAPNYDEIDRIEIERLIVDDLGCGSPQDARYKLDRIIQKLAAVTAERDRYKIALRVIAVWADNTPPSRPDIEARAMKALRGEVES
jgi:hypothetical protein